MKKIKYTIITNILFLLLLSLFLSAVFAFEQNQFMENAIDEENIVSYNEIEEQEILIDSIDENKQGEDIENLEVDDIPVIDYVPTLKVQSVMRQMQVIETKALLNIDTNLNNATFNRSIIHIEGWKLANITDTEIEVYIDNNIVDSKYIKYSYKYALTEIIKGYGTAEQNPKPHFDIDIPIVNYTQGKHSIKIKFVDSDKNVLDSLERTIYIDKNIKSVLNIDTKISNQTFDIDGINIEGWKLANVANSNLKIYVDNTAIDVSYIKYSYKYALTEIVKGYGTSSQNPKPHFNINIPIDNFSQGTHRLIIQLVAPDGSILQNQQFNINIDKTIKSVLNIDTKLSNQTFDKYGIKIEGWKLAKVPNTTLKVFIDNVQINKTNTKYSYKYALTEIVKGYGTAEQNPNPHFEMNIPTTDITHGSHKLLIQLVSSDGKILQNAQFNINIDKTIKSILNIDTTINNMTFGKNVIHIEGWKLATDANTKLNVYLNNKKVDESYIKYSCKYALTEIIKGYGNSEDNPKPHFDIDIATKSYEDGKYTLKIELATSTGKVLKTINSTIYIKNQYLGIDVSSYNGSVNWKLVKDSGIEFAMIRLGYRGYRNPVLVLDSSAIANIKLAQAAGIKVGVYFVTQAITVAEAQEEALWVIETLDKNSIKLDYPVAIDTELSTANTKNGDLPGRADLLDVNTRTQICKAFCDVINYYKRTPMIYANTYWFEYNLDLSKLAAYDIWLANYTAPRLSVEYDIWQHTSNGSINGILGNVDLDICYKKY